MVDKEIKKSFARLRKELDREEKEILQADQKNDAIRDKYHNELKRIHKS